MILGLSFEVLLEGFIYVVEEFKESVIIRNLAQIETIDMHRDQDSVGRSVGRSHSDVGASEQSDMKLAEQTKPELNNMGTCTTLFWTK